MTINQSNNFKASLLKVLIITNDFVTTLFSALALFGNYWHTVFTAIGTLQSAFSAEISVVFGIQLIHEPYRL